MSPADVVNGLFEGGGSLMLWLNVRQIYRDKGYAGIYLPATALWVAWGGWNLYYYPSLGQWWSFAGGVSVVIANIVWVSLMLHYGKKEGV